jgi:hypothetical protein
MGSCQSFGGNCRVPYRQWNLTYDVLTQKFALYIFTTMEILTLIFFVDFKTTGKTFEKKRNVQSN